MPTSVATRTAREASGRQDPEVRALLRAAEAGLETPRISVLYRRADTPEPSSWRWFFALVVVLAIPAIGLPLRLSMAATEPKPKPRPQRTAEGIWDAAAFVESKAAPSSGRFLIATVKKGANPKRDTAEAMRQSQRNAIAAAIACTKIERPDIRLHTRGVRGPSAGLMFGLTLVDHLIEADLTTGRQVAGTGVLSAAGRVGPVGAVAAKAIAAQHSGASVFLVPAKQAAEAKRAAPKLNVIGVDTLDAALRAVSGVGCAR